MAYNKSKYVEAAQKLLNQGKVAQAIAEYQNILKHEPRDQVTLMTIGELYIRQGETFQAIDYFERLAQIFVGDGFLTKAIAVYKRIAKLAPEEIRPLEKLADLYVQQGVMSEARPLFLQLAEIHLKNNRQPEAIGLLKKLLQAEPDNLRIQIRLADLYQAMGQTRDAIEAYVSASQRALARGDQGESEKLADKALKLEPHNLAAVIVKARSHSSQGNHAKATQLLEQAAGLEKGGEQTELLLDLYLKNSDWDQASALAHRVFEADEKNFGPIQKVVESLLQSGNPEKAMEILEKSRLPMIDAGEHEVVGKLLNELASSMPGAIEPLEWLVELYGRTSDSFRLPDALAHLGDALVAGHQWEHAKQIFQQLVDRDPDSDSAKRKLNGVLRKMGQLPAGEAEDFPEENLRAEIPKAPAAKLPVDDEEESTPEVSVKPAAVSSEPALDEETQKFIAQSLTDVDLFASYGLTQKAIGLLEAILRRAPRHPKCRKSICPTNGRPFSKRRVLPKRLLLLQCRRSPLLPRLRVKRSLGMWKSFRLAKNRRSLSHPKSQAPLPQFRSSRSPSLKKRRPSLRPSKCWRPRLRRNLPRRANRNSNWNRSMNSYWMRSRWCPRMTRNRPKNQSRHARQSGKTQRRLRPPGTALLRINFLRILPTKSISSVSAN